MKHNTLSLLIPMSLSIQYSNMLRRYTFYFTDQQPEVQDEQQIVAHDEQQMPLVQDEQQQPTIQVEQQAVARVELILQQSEMTQELLPIEIGTYNFEFC